MSLFRIGAPIVKGPRNLVRFGSPTLNRGTPENLAVMKKVGATVAPTLFEAQTAAAGAMLQAGPKLVATGLSAFFNPLDSNFAKVWGNNGKPFIEW